MKNPNQNELIDKAVAGRLSPEEEVQWNALVAKHPELEEEIALGQALSQLPAPPKVSSNFTALVMQEIRREERAPQRGFLRWLRWPRLAPITASLVLAACLAVSMLQRQQTLQNTKTAETLAEGVTAVASSEMDSEAIVSVFQNFDTIRNLPEAGAGYDSGLLAVLRTE